MALDDTFLRQISQTVLLASLDEPETIRYRQDILTDCIAEPEVIREMYAVVVDALEDKRGIWGSMSQYPESILSGALSQLESFVIRLAKLRKIADDHAHRFRSEGLRTLFHSLHRELDDDRFQAIDHHLRQLRFHEGELLSAQLDRDNSGTDYVLHSSGHSRHSWTELFGIIPRRTSYSFRIPPGDEADAQALSDLSNRALNSVANAAAQSADHISRYFAVLRTELGFYVGCLNLRDELVSKGVPISLPEPSTGDSLMLSSVALCDACLALQMKSRVFGNDIEADGKSLVVITGANSGGKSTFLRSVGVAQLMMQCGMFVAAQSYRANVCSGIFTHFAREEDASVTSGRLDEELSRMSKIADRIRPYCLMLFNESFGATNEREGSEIARQVVRALLEAQVKVLFVTHQFDFAESFFLQCSDSALFLRAQRQPDGERRFELKVGEPLPTSFGEDLYWRIGRWLEEDDGVGEAPGSQRNRRSGSYR